VDSFHFLEGGSERGHLFAAEVIHKGEAALSQVEIGAAAFLFILILEQIV
jgi:hypothetical protein